MCGILFAVGCVFELAVFLSQETYSPLGIYWHLGGVLLSAGMWRTARSKRFLHARVMRIGLLYEILLCLLVATATQDMYYDQTGHLVPVTWALVFMVVFPLVVPSPPRMTLGVAICAALMSLLAVFLVSISTTAEPTVYQYLDVGVSTGFAVAVAYFSSRVVYGITVDVARATEVGPYRLEEKLGQGGMGEVWRARHRLLARPAAVKLIRPGVLKNKTAEKAEIAVKRFTREAQVTANLNSSHTVELYDFGITEEGVFYYVMELLDGLDLESLVRIHGPMPPARAIHLLVHACDSLADAHHSGLVHRDIKPANILACRKGLSYDFTKVLDFGLVALREHDGVDLTRLSQDDAIRGTPHFLAPEIARGDKSIDGRADLYCLGCVAFWMLTGKPVFDRGAAVPVILAHVHDMPPAPSSLAGQAIPADLDALILECLQKDPKDRPPDALALARGLEQCAVHSPWTQDDARAWWQREYPSGAEGVIKR